MRDGDAREGAGERESATKRQDDDRRQAAAGGSRPRGQFFSSRVKRVRRTDCWGAGIR